ncbi:discoidin domain-containing protein [Sphingobacterium multivorum]|uniref:discoidin domain-containing protein n=1 Tax=Sphingobacterium multivorum TaxID=28454 RepID=UPI0031BAAE8C
MKRNFKMSWAFNAILGAFLLSTGSCKEEELVFPQQGNQETVVTETRPTAKPTNLTYVSAFNQNIEIHWPTLSDRVVKAQIKYKDGAADKILDITKFSDPTIIHLSELKSYSFLLQYFTSDGTGSKVTQTTLSPRAYEADYKVANVSAQAIPGGVTFIFPNTSRREIPGKLSYAVEGKSFEVDLKGNMQDTVTISNLTDETKKIDFSLKFQDDQWKRTATGKSQMAPGLLTYKLIRPTVVPYIDGNNLVLAWDNETQDPVTVNVQYELNGVKKTATLAESTDVKGKLSFDVQGKATAIAYTLKTEGLTSPIQQKQVNPLGLVNKALWSASASSVETEEGEKNGKPESLIDGDITTFWHSTWSDGEPPYPHWFIIDMAKVEAFGRFGMIRRYNNTNGFKTFNIEVSLDKVNWKMIGKDLNFNSADSPAAWQDYSVAPVNARYIRITMTASRNGTSLSTHLGEFRAYAY